VNAATLAALSHHDVGVLGHLLGRIHRATEGDPPTPNP
jgi:hypothetical protein